MADNRSILRWIVVFNNWPNVHERYEEALGELVRRWNSKHADEADPGMFPFLKVDRTTFFPYWGIRQAHDDVWVDVGDLCRWFNAQFDQAALEEVRIQVSRLEALTVELAHWYLDQGLEPRSADEWAYGQGDISLAQYSWLQDFCRRWDAAQQAEDA